MPVERIGGLVSGMDTDSLVKKLMDAERVPVNKLKQKRQKLIWQSDMYRQWNSDLWTFRNKTLSDMKFSKMYGTFSVTSSDDNKVSAVATAEAIAGTHKVEVLQLAEPARVFGKNPVDKVTADADLTITMGNGKSATVTIKKDATMSGVASAINGARDSEGKSLGLQAYYDDTLKQLVISAKDTGSGSSFSLSGTGALLTELGISQKEAKFTGNTGLLDLSGLAASGLTETVLNVKIGTTEKAIKISASDNEHTLKDKLSRAFSGVAGVQFDDSTAGKFKITAPNGDPTTGDSITFSAPNDTVLQALGVAPASINSATTIKAHGMDAQVKYNDSEFLQVSTNTVKIFGTNYTFKDKGVTTVTVSRDLDAEIKNIKEFVNKYNELIEKINKAVNEPVYRDYQPLTDEERKALTEKQIEQWEEKAKSGLVRGDSTLSSLVSMMRLHMTEAVDNGSKYNSLASIGIKSNSYQDEGKLYVDEDKLRQALEEDPEAVQNMFIQGSDEKGAKRGLIHRLISDVEDAMTNLTEKAGKTGSVNADTKSVIGKLLRDLDKQIYEKDRDLSKKEDAYYKKFAAMEKAMSQYSAQSGWLAQQFAAR